MQHDRQRRRVITTLAMAIALCARVATAGSISLQWDSNVELDVRGYRVFVGEQPGVSTSSVDVGNVTTWSYREAIDGQRYCFSVAAYSAGPRLGARSVEVCTEGSADDAPTLVNPGNQSHQSGAALTLTLVGSDPEGSPVTYSATGLPTGLVLNKNTGFVSGTPSAAGTFNARATVSDGKLSTSHAFTWTIRPAEPGSATPLRPAGTVATATPVFEWESVPTATSYRLWIDDASANDVQVDYTPAQAGCTVAGAVCHVTPGVALAAGRASWSVRSSNPVGGAPWSGALDFTVQLPAGAGKGPTVTIDTPSATGTYVTDKNSITLTGVAGADGTVTQVSWSNNRGPASGNTLGTKVWRSPPIALSTGVNALTITVRDNAGKVATAKLSVTRTDQVAPTVTVRVPTASGSYSTSAGSIDISGKATDDVRVQEVSWTNSLGGNGTAVGTTSWTASAVALQDGVNVITVTVKDDAGNRSSVNVRVTKTGSSAAAATAAGAAAPKAVRTSLPKLKLTAPTTGSRWSSEKASVVLRGEATDNVMQVTWSSDGGGSGVATGTTRWAIKGLRLDRGENKITLTATDASGRTDRQVLTITYQAP